jgi:putative SOS response-associated peptidase YedK
MCGRYTLKTDGSRVVALFELYKEPELEPRYNIAPTQQIPVVLEDSSVGGRTLEMMHWGLIPSWANDPSIGSRMINARAETVSEKPSYRSAFKKRRCVIPADGFYEWKKTADGKQPYYLRLGKPAPGERRSVRICWTVGNLERGGARGRGAKKRDHHHNGT